MAAHLTAFLTCLILVAMDSCGESWLTERQRSIALVTGFAAAYAGLVSNIFNAVVDMPGPVSRPDVVPPMPQLAIALAFLAVIVTTTLTAFKLVLYGMRGEPDPRT